ncbi:hypothetical protein CHS0354_010778 [Potamilus streckersoni]|uniref:Fibrinogen C-terminal domain-containing protein n=1 Tax=Potamilus streckersoni TaxID=2493646 RepID=A0AAE0T939_9BIVA|nr:hypothetical protein CHS0354_010778 [Potamilus streckersoni]
MRVQIKYFIFLTLGFTFIFFKGTALESYFCESDKCTNLSSRICTKYLIWTVTQIRKSQCFLKCLSHECQAVFYNEITQTCQGHSSVLTVQDDCRDEDGTKYYQKCTGKRPHNCTEIFCSGQHTTGIYTIYPTDDSNGVSVRCDMDTDGGGWTVFQRRVDGSVDFNRPWADYKLGFGNADSEYWLGLYNINKLTSQGNVKLRVDLFTPQPPERSAYAVYSSFKVGDENSSYLLAVTGYSGSAGDSLKYQNNMKFTTKDKDNDLRNFNCAIEFFGGWWYSDCHACNLNGLYGSVEYGKGLNWISLSGLGVSMKFVEMKLK